jgi:small subunit ribosomal protein S18
MRQSTLLQSVRHIDYKDLELLKKFLTPHARIVSRKRMGVSAKDQRRIALAVKRARYMGFLPYTSK